MTAMHLCHDLSYSSVCLHMTCKTENTVQHEDFVLLCRSIGLRHVPWVANANVQLCHMRKCAACRCWSKEFTATAKNYYGGLEQVPYIIHSII
jgi:hypothetical protein